jgi:hypothetical protein
VRRFIRKALGAALDISVLIVAVLIIIVNEGAIGLLFTLSMIKERFLSNGEGVGDTQKK